MRIVVLEIILYFITLCKCESQIICKKCNKNIMNYGDNLNFTCEGNQIYFCQLTNLNTSESCFIDYTAQLNEGYKCSLGLSNRAKLSYYNNSNYCQFRINGINPQDNGIWRLVVRFYNNANYVSTHFDFPLKIQTISLPPWSEWSQCNNDKCGLRKRIRNCLPNECDNYFEEYQKCNCQESSKALSLNNIEILFSVLGVFAVLIIPLIIFLVYYYLCSRKENSFQLHPLRTQNPVPDSPKSQHDYETIPNDEDAPKVPNQRIISEYYYTK